MTILNTATSVFFPHVENIKKEYILNEQILKDKFNAAGILPIPDDAPVEIPRIVISTIKEHSQLNIAPETVNFQTIYDNEFSNDWEKCEEYIKSRMDDVFKLTDILTNNRYSYVGIVTNILWDDITESANAILYKNITKKDAPNNLDDFSVKYTYIENDKYYINITIQSLKDYGNKNIKIAGELSDSNIVSRRIQITLDVNDRLAFNNNVDYLSNKESFNEVLKLTTMIINEKLNKLVNEGDY